MQLFDEVTLLTPAEILDLSGHQGCLHLLADQE